MPLAFLHLATNLQSELTELSQAKSIHSAIDGTDAQSSVKLPHYLVDLSP